MTLKNTPASLDSIVLAVILRIVNKLDCNIVAVSEHNQSLHELTTTAGYFRTIIQVDHDCANIGIQMLSYDPPIFHLASSCVASARAFYESIITAA